MLYTTMTVGTVEKALAQWGISRCNREHLNQGGDTFGFDLQADFDAEDQFPFATKIILKIGRVATAFDALGNPTQFAVASGHRFYVGYSNEFTRYGTGKIERFKYKFSGLWEWFFEHHTFQKQWAYYQVVNGTVQPLALLTNSQVVIGEYMGEINTGNTVNTFQQTIAEALIEAATWTMNQMTAQFGAPQFQIDTALANSNFDGVGGWNGYFPMQAANNIMVSEVIKKCLSLVPQSSAWFDCSTDPPTLRIQTRNIMPAVTLPLEMGGLTKPEIRRRDDLVPVCIDFKYKITTTVNGTPYLSLYDDIACPLGATDPNGSTPLNLLPYRTHLNGQIETFDFSGGNVTVVDLQTVPIPFDNSGYSLVTWMTMLASSMGDASITGVQFATDALGNPYWATLTTPDGRSADTRYLYFMVGGPCPNGVIDKINQYLTQGVKMTLAQTFVFTENTKLADGSFGPATIKTERKTCDLYCYSMSGGRFTTGGTPAEVIPFGLAKFIYDIESVPQYQGTWTVTEQEITDICPMGKNLCISGGLPEWLTMNAQVQQIAYDLVAGTTTLTFGPAKHLGPDDFIQRMRVNRGPRWLYLYNTTSGATNQSPAISGPTQLKDTQGALGQSSYLWQPSGTPPPGTPLGTPAVPIVTPAAGTGPTATPATPVGITHNTLPTATSGVPAAPLGGQSTWNAGNTDNTSVNNATIVTSGDAAVAAIGTSTPIPLTPGIKMRALMTCEGTVTHPVYRVFLCSDKIVKT